MSSVSGSSEVVGFVGAGQMGLPMVARLAAAGRAPIVLARRPAVEATVTDAGGTPVGSLAGLAGCSVVVVCVFDEHQLEEVITGSGGLLDYLQPGSVVVSHVTSGLAATRAYASAAEKKQVQFLDAPISGTATAIAAGQLTVLLGGDEALVARCTPIVEAYAAVVRHTGAVGTATTVKLLNNALFAANIQLAATAVALAEAEGVAPEVSMEALGHCSGASTALRYMLAAGGPTPFATQVIHYLRKDVAALRESAAVSDMDLGVIDSTIATGPLQLT